MTPKQALEILTQATANIPMSRQAHLQVMEAIQTLQALNTAAEAANAVAVELKNVAKDLKKELASVKPTP